MPVTMTGSPTATGTVYPQVGYSSAANTYKEKRAAEEKAKKAKLKNDFEELRKKKLNQAEKQAKERKEKRAKDELAYKQRMAKMREKSIAERNEEQTQRATALHKVETEHAAWLAEQQARERKKHARTELHGHGAIDGFPIAPDSFAELELDDTLAAAFETSTDGLFRQRAQDEANEMERQAKEKHDRERKAEQRRQELLQRSGEEERHAREEAHRVKKEMAAQTKAERESEEVRQQKMKEVGLEQRKKNDEYDKWLSTDHIRTIAEQAHERKDPSKMHEGGKFSGIPTDFTPGV